MRKTFALLIGFAIIAGVAPYARSLGTPSAPPGVAANDWIALGDAAGFVIAHDAGRPMSDAARHKPGTVSGYFMVRRQSTWLRVDPVPPYDVQKAVMSQ
jgi:hypothetical protein